MRLIKWCLLVYCCLILVTSLVIVTGRGQPPSDGLALLHLDECELPCWLGIVPGTTTWRDAMQAIESEYNSGQYSVRLIDDSHIEVGINGTSNFLRIEITPSSYTNEESSVYRIMLTPSYEDPNLLNISLKLGDIVASIGTPTDVILSPSGELTPVMRFKHHIIQLQYFLNPCFEVMLRQPIVSLAIYAVVPDFFWLSEPSNWRGFTCYKFVERSQ